MDQLELKQQVQAFKKLRENYENQLRIFGLDLSDLTDEISTLLSDCVDLQRHTHLHDIREQYIKEFYYIKKKEALDNRAIINKYKAENVELEAQIAADEADCAILEKFIANVNKRLLSETELQKHKNSLEVKMQSLQERQDALKTPDDLNIDELIKKVNLLKQLNKPKK